MKPYFTAEEMRQKRKDSENWYIGAYVLNAVYVAVSKCLAGDESNAKYPEHPFSFQEEQARTLGDAEKFGMWVSAFNANRSTQD